MNPLQIIKDAIKAVPAVRFALGVAGIAAVVALVLGLKLNPAVAVFGTLIVLGLMFVLVLFSQYAGTAESTVMVGPITVLVWFYVIALMVVTALFISSYFLHVPPFPFHDPTPLPPAAVKRFSHAFTFDQRPFSLSMPNNGTWNHGASSLEETGEFSGREIYIDQLKVSLGIDNKKGLVCCDVWVYVGATPFGFPRDGGTVGNGGYPPYDEPSAAARAPVLAKLVVGSGGTVFPQGQQKFWAAYDFQKQQASGYPQVDNVKQTVSQSIAVDKTLYAQVFVWNGNPSVDVDVTNIKLEIEGTLH